MRPEMPSITNGVSKRRSGYNLRNLKRRVAIHPLFFRQLGPLLFCKGSPTIKNGARSSINTCRILEISFIELKDIACIWSIKSIQVTHESSSVVSEVLPFIAADRRQPRQRTELALSVAKGCSDGFLSR